MSHVLIVSIGPVQEFIASGRKCRDLWFGSWLLSELARAAGQAIADTEGDDALVFPGGLAAKGQDTEASVANKIVAWVNTPRSAAEQAKQAVRRRLRELADEAFARVGNKDGKKDPKRNVRFFEETAREQVAELIECLWAHADAGTCGGYAGARREAERLLAARKNTKLWSQPGWAGSQPKSSLDGVRESVLHESLFDSPRVVGARFGSPPDETFTRIQYGVHGAERLCGVGLLKRFGGKPRKDAQEPQRIFSTPHLAALPYLDGLAHRDGKAAFDAFIDVLNKIDPRITDRLDVLPGNGHEVSGAMDGAILFRERLREAVEEATPNRADQGTKAETAQQALEKFLSDSSGGEPSPYFAVLLADGDNMGKAINELQEAEQHKALSRQLEGFASCARKIVTEEGGRLIYSGGDDVLAFVPIHKVLSCAERLAEDFASRLAQFKCAEDSASPTLSMGVVLAHALVPLDGTLDEARKAEKVAKAVPGKDAICVRVIKRGGAPVEIAGKRTVVLGALNEFVGRHRNNELSSKAQYELMGLDRLTAGATGEEKKDVEELVKHQAARIVERRHGRGGAAVSQVVRDRARAAMRDPAATERGPEKLGDPAAVGRALYVAQLIARAKDQAEPKETR